MTMTIPLATIGLFLGAIATQVAGAYFLPRTNGFTDLFWTALCLPFFIVSLWFIAILIRQGVALNIVVPLISSAVPLATIGVAYFGYGEVVSLPKLGLLVAACCSVGIAGSMT